MIKKLISIIPLLSIQLVHCNNNNHICLMLYQIADNNLEPFIRQDLYELSKSSLIQSSRVTTWVYFDGTDQTSIQDFAYSDKGESLMSYYSKGSYKESMYLTFRHDYKKLVLDTKFSNEINSDDPDTVIDFVIHALQDCIARSSNKNLELMLLFSSHGTGFAGYGGDDDKRRKLLQSNESLSQAIQTALFMIFNDYEKKIDVLGFDACLMSSFVAIHEYAKVSKYVLGSESTEPGHGWFYHFLDNDSSVLDIALTIQYDYIHRNDRQAAPKLLALIDTNAYSSFHTYFEYLSMELNRLLSDNDMDFHSFLQRSRASSVAFDSALDPSGSEYPSAVDIGSFLMQFYSLCQPRKDTTLYNYLIETIKKYDDMFVARGVGPGTPAGTGMHVIWPFRSVYYDSIQPPATLGKFDYALLRKDYIVDHAPRWFNFLQTYLTTKHIRGGGNDASVCSRSTSLSNNNIESLSDQQQIAPSTFQPTNGATEEPTHQPTKIPETPKPTKAPTVEQITTNPTLLDQTQSNNDIEIQSPLNTEPPTEYLTQTSYDDTINNNSFSLLINPTYDDTGEIIQIQTQLSPETDYITIEVGIDLSGLYSHRRQLSKNHEYLYSSSLRNLISFLGHKNNENDYFRMYLGTVQPFYKDYYANAIWDRDFIFLGDDINDLMPVHAYDRGNNARSIPVLYFSSSIHITQNDIPIGSSVEDALLLGATFGSLHFGYDSASRQITTDGFTLYTNSINGNNTSTITETPPSNKGQIVPILFVDGFVDGYKYDVFVGGFAQTILSWNDNHSLKIKPVRAQNYLKVVPNVDTLLIRLIAVDSDVNESGGMDGVVFEIRSPSSSAKLFFLNTFVSAMVNIALYYFLW